MVRPFDRYLDDIGREPLLAPEEESRLARRARAGDAAALNRLVSANLRFVVSVARHYQGRGLPIADLVNEGNIGLLEAARRFDPRRDVRFVTYAHWWVRRAIVEALRRERAGDDAGGERLARVSLDVPLAGAATLQDVLPDERVPSPERELSRRGLRRAVEASLFDLTGRERDVLRRYFGLGVDGPCTLAEISTELGISRERARRLKERALARLRARSGRHDLAAFRDAARPVRRRDSGSVRPPVAVPIPIDFAGPSE